MEHALDLDAEAVEDDAPGVVGGTADGIEADLLADQVLEGLDLGPHIDVHVAEEHRDDVVHTLVDAGDLLHVLEIVEHVGVGNRKIDALQIDEISDVADGAIADDRQHAQIIAVVECLAEVGGILGEGALEQSARESYRPIVDACRLVGFLDAHRLVGNRQGSLRRRRHLRQVQHIPRALRRSARCGRHPHNGKAAQRNL